MQFDDPKHVLEAAAAKPSRPVDAPALVRRGRRMRRARFAAGAAGLAVVVAGASASFGLLGTEGEGPGPAGRFPACESSDLSVVMFLRDDATDAQIEALRKDLERDPGVTELDYVAREDAWQELQELYREEPLYATISPDALPVSFRIEAADESAAERLADTTSPLVDEVLADPEGESFACFVQRACAAGPAAPSVAIYLRDDAAPREVKALKVHLDADPNVVNVKHVTKREAYEEFRELYSDQPAMWENLPTDALPASLRIEVVDEAARERIAGIESPVIDEVVEGGDLIAELCPEGVRDPVETASPAPEPSTPPEDLSVPPPELGAAFGDHVNDVFVTIDEAQCDTTPSWSGAPAPEPGRRWCRFRVSVLNLSDETFHFDTRSQLLQTSEPSVHIYRPWEPETTPPSGMDELLREVAPPALETSGWLVYRLRADEEPEFLTLSAPGLGSATGRTGAFGCREILAVDGRRCSYWSDRALLRFRYVTSVELYRCGVEPLSFAGRRWISDRPPFDATNAPADFTGTGVIELVTEKEAIYTDSSGAQIELRADEEWEPPPCG